MYGNYLDPKYDVLLLCLMAEFFTSCYDCIKKHFYQQLAQNIAFVLISLYEYACKTISNVHLKGQMPHRNLKCSIKLMYEFDIFSLQMSPFF